MNILFLNFFAVFVEAAFSELLMKEVDNDAQAFELYNDYAFRCGFGIRRDKIGYREDRVTVRQRKFVCSYEGFKIDSGPRPKVYKKLDVRCGCKAFIQFDVCKHTGKYVVVKHHMVHNHSMVPVDKRHLIRSHRNVSNEDYAMISNMKNCGVRVSDAVRCLRKEVGGEANLGYTERDVYDVVAAEKKRQFDGCDTNQLIVYFSKRQATELDFFYDVEVNEIGQLVSFFWRDGRMRRDYEIFGDLVIHDTTYRTNKYSMICGPFVGMNHHAQNIMFGIGFILDEKIESFVWLFNSFLRSMGDRHPITFMTDQSAAMAAAIR